MTTSDRTLKVLEAVLERMGRIEDGQEAANRISGELVELAKAHASELSELRGRLIEDSSRRGAEIQSLQRAQRDLGDRLHRLELKSLNGKGHGA